MAHATSPAAGATGKAALSLARRQLQETSNSRSLPDLPSPGRRDANWVSRTGGLASYDKRIATHL